MFQLRQGNEYQEFECDYHVVQMHEVRIDGVLPEGVAVMMWRMTDGQLEQIHNEALLYRKLAENNAKYADISSSQSAQSIAASNLVIIELLLRQGEKKA
jgi:hypothetical protein